MGLIHYIHKPNLLLSQDFFSSQELFFEMMVKLSGVFLVVAALAYVKPTTAQMPDARCTQKPEVGLCKALYHNFYYDPDTNSCLSFIYGGCGGNENNFESKKVCEKTCKRIWKYMN